MKTVEEWILDSKGNKHKVMDNHYFFEEVNTKRHELDLYSKWIKANDVQDIEFEEVTNKTEDNDKPTNLGLGLQVYAPSNI